MTLTLAMLRDANIARDKEWNTGSERIPLSFRGNELAGEAGEACNVIKKLERVRLGLKGSVSTTEALAEELADVVICADLIAMDCGINLATAIEEKFNATSMQVGLNTMIGGITLFESWIKALEQHGYKVLPAESEIGDAQVEQMILELERRGYRVIPRNANPKKEMRIKIDAQEVREALDEIEKKIIEMAAVAKARQKIDPPDGSFASVIPALLEDKSVYRESKSDHRYRIFEHAYLIEYEVPTHAESWSRHALFMAADLRATDWKVAN